MIGDLDPLWIENLNSVLDDNRLYTLPTGEWFLFPSELNIIFETEILKEISNATISRLGIINVNLD